MVAESLHDRHLLRTLLIAAACGVVPAPSPAQTTAADGPWSGFAQCVLTVQLQDPRQSYLNEQIHTWVLTGSTPTVSGVFRVYPATWTVTGQGSSQRDNGTGQTVSQQWITAGQPLADTITVRLSNDGVLHFDSGAQLRSPGAMSGTTQARTTNGNAPGQTSQISSYVDEWKFPIVQDVATSTSISGSSTIPFTGSIAPGAPPGTTSSAACSWQFVKSTAGPAPPGPLSGLPPPGAIGGRGRALPAPTAPSSSLGTGTAVPIAPILTATGPTPAPSPTMPPPPH